MIKFSKSEMTLIISLMELRKIQFENWIESEKRNADSIASYLKYEKTMSKMIQSLSILLENLKLNDGIEIPVTKFQKEQIAFCLKEHDMSLQKQLPKNWQSILFWVNMSEENSLLIKKIDVVNAIYKKLKLKNIPNMYNLGIALIDELHNCKECLISGQNDDYYKITFISPNRKKALRFELKNRSSIMSFYRDEDKWVLEPTYFDKTSFQFIKEEIRRGQGIINLVTTAQAKELLLKNKEKWGWGSHEDTFNGVFNILDCTKN